MDFRGYLQQQGQQGDNYAQALLGYVGNDVTGQGTAGINLDKLSNDIQYAPNQVYGYGSVDNAVNAVNNYYRDYAGYNGGYSGPGSATNNKVSADFVNQAYNTKISGLRGIMDTLNPQEDAARLNVNNQFTNQSNALKSQKAIGERNLGLAQEQVDTGRVKSLADLRRQVETQGRSYANQLGSYGAGDSSAAGLINQALSGIASRNRSDVLGSAAQQTRAIDLQTQDLNTEFGNNLKMLEDWKNTSLNDIATKFLQQRQAIQQQMQTADADRYQALAQLDASYTQQAINQLASLEGQYRQSANDLIGQYKNLQGPNVGISADLQQFQVNPISAGKIGQLSSIPSASAGNQPTPVAMRRPFEQDYGFGL